MSMTGSDPLSDMFTRMRNAGLAGHKIVPVISTKLTRGVAKALLRNGFIDAFEGTFLRRAKHAPVKFDRFLLISLKYNGIPNYGLRRGDSAIKDVQRVSKPGARRYVQTPSARTLKSMSTLSDGVLTFLLSTNLGVLTAEEARKLKTGGEILGFVKHSSES